MTKRKLEKELKKTRKVRDQWCAEYTQVRDELQALRRDLRKQVNDALEGLRA